MPTPKHLRHLYKTPSWFIARAKVKERAKNHCERCGAANGATGYWEKGKTILTRFFVEITPRDRKIAEAHGKKVIVIQCGCAHLNGVAGDDRLENLAWLCRGDHLRHDRVFHKRSREKRKDQARPVL